MHYLTFAPVMELEQFIFENCSFDQPPISHPSPLRASDKPSPSSKSTYSETTHWLQQSQNIDHFWKKDMALVKALRQYHFTSNVLEGRTQWKFQKSWILHKVLDVIAMNMESTGRCLDLHDLMPMDQDFQHQDPNLQCLKAVVDKDLKVRQLKQKVIQGQYAQFYFIKKGVLYRSVVDNGHKFEAAVVPEDLIHTVLHLGHNQSGHNGYQRTYAAIKCVYYWKGMRKHVLVHCKSCPTCAKQRVQKTQFEKQIFEPGVQPMEFVCINLIGEFYPPSSKGNRYA